MQALLESVHIPAKGTDIAHMMEKEKSNDEFYQSLWWHDIIKLDDKQTLYTFIDKFCPDIDIVQNFRIRLGEPTEKDMEYLAAKFKKRTASEYHEFFGTNM